MNCGQERRTGGSAHSDGLGVGAGARTGIGSPGRPLAADGSPDTSGPAVPTATMEV